MSHIAKAINKRNNAMICSQILSIFKTIYGDQSVEFVCGFWGLKG